MLTRFIFQLAIVSDVPCRYSTKHTMPRMIITHIFVTGVCKHLHVADAGASQAGVDIASVRRVKAENLHELDLYTVAADSVEVIDADGNGGIVDINTQKCTCVANSHGVDCVCLIVARLTGACEKPTENIHHVQESDGDLHVPEEKDCATLIEDLYLWSKSSSYQNNPDLRNALKRAHTMAFGSFVNKKRANKRKITALHSYRKKINAAKHLQHKNRPDKAPCTKLTTQNPQKESIHVHSFKRKGGCIQSRTKYHKRMKLPESKCPATQPLGKIPGKT